MDFLSNLGLSAVGGLIDYFTGTARANQQFNHNKQLMQLQYDLNQQSIDKQNAYNSPANQMQLYQAAGINPYAVIGNINGRQPASGNVGLGSVQQAKSTDFLANYNAVLQAQLTRAQIKKVQSDTKGQEIKNQRDEGTLPYDIEASSLNIQRIGQDLKIGDKVLTQKDLEIEAKEIENYVAENSKDALISINWSQSKLHKIKADIEGINLDIAQERLYQIYTENDVLAINLAQQLEILGKMRMENYVYAAIADTLIENAYLQNKKVQSDISKNYAQTQGIVLDNEFKSETLEQRVRATEAENYYKEEKYVYSAALAKTQADTDFVVLREKAKQAVLKTRTDLFNSVRAQNDMEKSELDVDFYGVDKFFEYLNIASQVYFRAKLPNFNNKVKR